MTTEAITPLRQRMIEDMSARKLDPHMQHNACSLATDHANFLQPSSAAIAMPSIAIAAKHTKPMRSIMDILWRAMKDS